MEWLWGLLIIIILVIIGVISILRWGFKTTKKGVKKVGTSIRKRKKNT